MSGLLGGLLAAEKATSKKVRVDLKDTGADRSYDILIGQGLLKEAGVHLAPLLTSKKICVVTDRNVAQIYLRDFVKALQSAGFSCTPPIILPEGEETKSFQQLEYIVEKALGYGLDRDSALVALGGGVVGDITGFAASIIMRGIPFVQVPTTLMSQVDSSVGGKTGINMPQGKNLAGAFYQPRTVLIDTETLETLPDREMLAGYAEVLKYALIDDPEFFEWLEENGSRLLRSDHEALMHVIEVSCRAKADIVAADEREEKGRRALLNFGHTFGHALEALGGYDGRLLHGEAVAIGMLLAFDYSAEAGLCTREDVVRLQNHMEQAGMMSDAPFAVTAADMLEKMRGDKKSKDGRITLILARGIGDVFVSREVDEKVLEKFLRRAVELKGKGT